MCKHVFIIFALSLCILSPAWADVTQSPQDQLINQFDSSELSDIRNSCCPWSTGSSGFPSQECNNAIIRQLQTQTNVIPVHNQRVPPASNIHAPTAAQVMANSPSNGPGSIGYGSMLCATGNGPGR